MKGYGTVFGLGFTAAILIVGRDLASDVSQLQAELRKLQVETRYLAPHINRQNTQLANYGERINSLEDWRTLSGGATPSLTDDAALALQAQREAAERYGVENEPAEQEAARDAVDASRGAQEDINNEFATHLRRVTDAHRELDGRVQAIELALSGASSDEAALYRLQEVEELASHALGSAKDAQRYIAGWTVLPECFVDGVKMRCPSWKFGIWERLERLETAVDGAFPPTVQTGQPVPWTQYRGDR